MACIALIIHVFLPSPVQTYSHGMFSLLPLPRLLSSYKMHVSKLTIRSSRIGNQMRYREPKKLVFRSVCFKNVIEICAHLQAECRIKHARYSLIIIIIQKYVKRMPTCFERNPVCTISIARVGPPNAVS